MSVEPQPPLTLIERIERALVLLACFIEMDGDVHVPMYERFEAALDQLYRNKDTKDRARHMLASHVSAGKRQAVVNLLALEATTHRQRETR
jgi:hypothetical protein